MSKKINHAAEAEYAEKWAESARSGVDTTFWFDDAQVHATLALDERERIANLQRYAEGLWESWEKDGVSDAERVRRCRLGTVSGVQIRGGLGLS